MSTAVAGPLGLTLEASPAPREVWEQLMLADRDALPTQSPGWVDCVCGSGSYTDSSRLYRTADGSRALLPMVSRSRPAAGLSAWESMPYAWGFGGLVAERPVDAALVSAVVRDLAADGPWRFHVRPNPLHASAWAAGTEGLPGLTAVQARAHVLDLAGGFDTVWTERMRATTRREVRQAERLGVRVETDRSGKLLPVLYSLLRSSTERWASRHHEPIPLARYRLRQRDPEEKLQRIARELGDRCRISVAWYQERPAAAILVLYGRNAHYTRGAMDEELAGRSRANRLLHKLAIEEACRLGCGAYHMGESGTSDGLAQFKSRFGAVAHSYAEYYVERIPVTRTERLVRDAVKRMIGFRDD